MKWLENFTLQKQDVEGTQECLFPVQVFLVASWVAPDSVQS